MAEQEFADYYEFLQISPNAEAETIQRVYRMLAARYHPDNPSTGDMNRFLELQKAIRILGDPQTRAEYDAQLNARQSHTLPIFEMKEFVVGIEAEANRRLGVLCLLYKRRRAQPDKPAMSLLEMEALTSFPREHLEFTLWYLREKSYVRRDETSSDFMVTSEGVDYVESKMPVNRIVYRLLKGPAPEREDSGQPAA